MDVPFGNGSAAVDPTADIPLDPSSSTTISGLKSINNSTVRKHKKKKKTLKTSDCGSSVSSASCSSEAPASLQGFKVSRSPKKIRVGSMTTTRKSMGPSDFDTLGLHIGMSIAAFVAQVLERKNDAGRKVSADFLSKICIMAVRESLANVPGNKFDNFLANFENSFRSTLMTLRLISKSSQNIQEQQPVVGLGLSNSSCSVASTPFFNNENLEENLNIHQQQQQLVLHDGQINQQLSTVEKSVFEQTRANNLKSLEIGLTMKKLQLKERELSLNSDSNILERWKLSMGFSKASFRAEKFKTQLQDARQVELLKKCLDFLVTGLIIMLLALAYGTYVYSHRRITEATEACSPPSESKSWWMPKSMSTFNTGLQLLRCQIQVFSRMLFGVLMIGAITVLLIQRSSASHQTMPITFNLLLLGVACGYAGKFCIDALGGSGNHWLIYWEALCLLHFFCNIFHSTLFLILNGPIIVAERVEHNKVFPYWLRRCLFYATLLFLPLLCGFMPFASPSEWVNHFYSQGLGFMEVLED
ncbi:hypothetical protein ACJIZ3_018204 [Penstemon smallii]|uniref:Protein CPR-5 n=1 Tax=Penstemon smallii TaxID=265156 RepID=A0ABD3SZ22_9LAMI